MKRNLLAIFAAVVAIAVSAFTTQSEAVKSEAKFVDPVYYIFTGTVQSNPDHYSKTPTVQTDCPDATRLCWLKITDVTRPGGGLPDGVIDAADFQKIFEDIDNGALTGNGTLNDDAEIAGVFSKKDAF